MDNAATGPTEKAMTTDVNLMNSFSQAGLPLLRGAGAYAKGSLNAGLPSYANRAFAGASTSGLEEATRQGQQERYGSLSRLAPGGNVLGASGTFAGSAAAGAREQAGVALSKANATVSQRDKMISSMLGQGSVNTNLSSNFGYLTNRALSGYSQYGSPGYAASQGLIAGLSPFAAQGLSALATPAPSPAGTPVQQAMQATY